MFVELSDDWEVVEGAAFPEGAYANICSAAPAVVHFTGSGADSSKGAGVRLEVLVGKVEVEIKLLLCALGKLLVSCFHLGICYIDGYAVLENVWLVVAGGVHGFINNTPDGKLGATLPADEAQESVGVLVVQAVDGFPAGGDGPVGKLLGCWHKEIDASFLGFAGLDVLGGVVGVFLYGIAFPAGNIVVGGNIFLSHIGGLEDNLASLNKGLEAVFDVLLYGLVLERVELTEVFVCLGEDRSGQQAECCSHKDMFAGDSHYWLIIFLGVVGVIPVVDHYRAVVVLVHFHLVAAFFIKGFAAGFFVLFSTLLFKAVLVFFTDFLGYGAGSGQDVLVGIGEELSGLVVGREPLALKLAPCGRMDLAGGKLASGSDQLVFSPVEIPQAHLAFRKAVSWGDVALYVFYVTDTLNGLVHDLGGKHAALLLVHEGDDAVSLGEEDHGLDATKGIEAVNIVILEVGNHFRALDLVEMDGVFLGNDEGVFYEVGLVDLVVADGKLDAVCSELGLFLVPEDRIAVEAGDAVYRGVDQRVATATEVASEELYLVVDAQEGYCGGVQGNNGILWYGQGVYSRLGEIRGVMRE